MENPFTVKITSPEDINLIQNETVLNMGGGYAGIIPDLEGYAGVIATSPNISTMDRVKNWIEGNPLFAAGIGFVLFLMLTKRGR